MNCVNSECSGKVSSSEDTAVCGLCNTKQCTKCKTDIEGSNEHSCDPNILASLNMISTTSKQCPGCNTSISKIYGCSQMFCTQCYTLFNFNTLRVERGFRHNPHYLEWIAANPDKGELVNQANQDDQDDSLDDLLSVDKWNVIFSVSALEKRFTSMQEISLQSEIPQNHWNDTMEITIAQIKNINEWLRKWIFSVSTTQSMMRYDEMTNLTLRVKFLKNEIDEDKFKQCIVGRVFKAELTNRLLTHVKAIGDLTYSMSEFSASNLIILDRETKINGKRQLFVYSWVAKMIPIYKKVCEDAAPYGKYYRSDNLEALSKYIEALNLNDN